MASKQKFVVNATMQAVDNLAKLRAKISSLKKEAEELEALVSSKLAKKAAGAGLEGYSFTVTQSSYDMRRLSEAKVAKYLTDAQLARCFSSTPVMKLLFSKRAK